MANSATRATRINHVSLPADDLDTSERFYVSVFGMKRIPAPNFGFPVRWLQLGDTQLHLQVQELEPNDARSRSYQHVGIEVDDFEAAYRALSDLGAFEHERGTRYGSIWLLPTGEVQMFFRDPYGNLVEIDWPDISTLDRAMFGGNLRVLEDDQQQDAWNQRATLFLHGPRAARPATRP